MSSQFSFLLPLAAAGLTDGIHPSMFAIGVFFISFLFFSGWKVAQVRLVGSFFVTSVFVTSLFLGADFLKEFRILELSYFISRIFYFLVAIFSFILGALSMRDWWLCQESSTPRKFILKLSTITADHNEEMREETKNNRRTIISFKLIVISVLCGFFLTPLASVCIGYSYLPAMVNILMLNFLSFKAFLYLVFYSIMFILPLLGFFVVTIWMIGSPQRVQVLRKHLSKIKVVQAALFFSVGLGLLYVVRS